MQLWKTTLDQKILILLSAMYNKEDGKRDKSNVPNSLQKWQATILWKFKTK